MSARYDEYLEEHIGNVRNAYLWLRENCPGACPDDDTWSKVENLVFSHDYSKRGVEYAAYDNYFYGNRSYECVREFNYAWLHHIHNNPHHWQYWVLNTDDEGEKILDIPHEYIVEMICDWFSFSFRDNKLDEILKYYDEHKQGMKLSQETRFKVESILKMIEEKVVKKDENK